MNSSANTENKIINVTVSVNKSLKNSDAAQYAEKLDWSIVSSVKKTETAETPKATEEVAKETTAPTTEVTAKETTSPSVKEDKTVLLHWHRANIFAVKILTRADIL